MPRLSDPSCLHGTGYGHALGLDGVLQVLVRCEEEADLRTADDSGVQPHRSGMRFRGVPVPRPPQATECFTFQRGGLPSAVQQLRRVCQGTTMISGARRCRHTSRRRTGFRGWTRTIYIEVTLRWTRSSRRSSRNRIGRSSLRSCAALDLKSGFWTGGILRRNL